MLKFLIAIMVHTKVRQESCHLINNSVCVKIIQYFVLLQYLENIVNGYAKINLLCCVHFTYGYINKNNTSYSMVCTVPRTLYNVHMTRIIKKYVAEVLVS
jgi:hypothetical protein